MSEGNKLFAELEELWGKIINSLSVKGAKAEDFKKAVNVLSDFSLQLQDALEYVLRNADASQREPLERIYDALSRENAKALCDELRRYGFSLRGTEVHGRIYDSDKESPRGLAYRILELTRMGKRDEVFFSLLNVFQGHPIEPALAKIFNPVYPDDLFKVFVYSFLSGLFGKKENNNLRRNEKKMKSVTITVIYEAHALNRDEKLGGNILSIKKLTRGKETLSFIGKPALRHYLFSALQRAYPKDWCPAPVAERRNPANNNQVVVQFDIPHADILTHAELDAFGYMYTIKKETSITRRAPVGITKAVSLFPYQGDMAFYANHDLVNRGIKSGLSVTPDPYNKEEHCSFYKASFTIDTQILGEDVWVVNEVDFQAQNNVLVLELPGGVKKEITSVRKQNNAENCYKYSNKAGNKVGEIRTQRLNSSKWKVTFSLDPTVKQERIKQLLEVIKDGLYAQSSNELNTLVPVFLVASAVKVPSPVFHPYLMLSPGGDREAADFQVSGLLDGMKNSWVEGPVFVFESKRVGWDRTEKEQAEKEGVNLTEEWSKIVDRIVENNPEKEQACDEGNC